MMSAAGFGVTSILGSKTAGAVATGVGRMVAGPERDPTLAGGLITGGLRTLGIGGGGVERG
jgi:hypothetical protein